MKADALPVPGLVLGAYPERRGVERDAATGPIERVRRFMPAARRARRYTRFIEQVHAHEPEVAALDAQGFEARLRNTRAAMARHGLNDALVARVFALAKRACAQALGIELYDTQLYAARVMLDRRLAEMATGEGKTFAAGLCAATAALAGIPVHVITANEYLVTRDADGLRPWYCALGLRVAALTQGLTPELRRRAYDADVVYCTAAELVFDYLRDGLARAGSRSDLEERVAGLAAGPAPRRTLLRGLCMALVDEADSVLIDDARVPLILSERRESRAERDLLSSALGLAARLAQGEHFVLDRGRMRAELTAAGRDRVEQEAAGGAWRHRLEREETLSTALAALHLYERDRHYLLRDGAVNIIDEATGRVAAGRVWSRGLHALIELKEGCAPSPDTATVAQITYQRFFRRYLALGGMSGTLHEARAELLSVYGLPVVQVPLGKPDRRRSMPTRLYPDRDAQWQAVVERAREVSRAGRPVLIGTDSVADSEALSQKLTAAGLGHAVLNARQDSEEAAIVAAAGEAGRITVATNMAGRGTDIALGQGVAERGGLHVISCQHNASRRIDRQLVGRCARHGDPGSAEVLLAIDTPSIARCTPRALARRVVREGLARPQWLVRALVRVPQLFEERRQRWQRRQLLERDRRAARDAGYGKPQE